MAPNYGQRESKKMTTPKVLPADIYDTLEFATLVFGGIGAGRLTEEQSRMPADVTQTPYCLFGYAGFLSGEKPYDFWQNDIADQLASVLAPDNRYKMIGDNNEAVRKINTRKKRADLNGRVTWREYTKETGIQRGN